MHHSTRRKQGPGREFRQIDQIHTIQVSAGDSPFRVIAFSAQNSLLWAIKAQVLLLLSPGISFPSAIEHQALLPPRKSLSVFTKVSPSQFKLSP